MSQRTEQIEKLFAEGASRLLGRATDDHGLTVETIVPRVKSAVGKYILRDDPQPAAAVVEEFIDKLQADDLCLIVACEQGNQNAWTDLVERFSATVRSAARSVTAWSSESTGCFHRAAASLAKCPVPKGNSWRTP